MPGESYDLLGKGYADQRREDARIASAIWTELGDARSVVNVGAGTGSYEPAHLAVLAVEPSDVMISQRPAGAAPCIRASAEALPLATGAYDAAMALLTIHHWSDWRAGLAQMRRVVRRRIVLLTYDAHASNFWLTRDYFPSLRERDCAVMPPIEELAAEPGEFHVTPVLVPHDCTDGFLGAYWRRPHVYLDPVARRSMSPFATIDTDEGLRRLASDLDSGAWRQRNSDLPDLEALDVGYRLVRWEFKCSTPASDSPRQAP